MNRKTWTLSCVIGLLIAAIFATARPALADDLVGVIRGSVFADSNESLSHNADEPALGGVEIELVNGENTQRVTTAEDGTFNVPVAAGTWRVTVLAPDGYRPLNDMEREVTIAADGTTEAVMDFALQALAPAAEVAGETAQTAEQAVILPESGADLGWRAAAFLALAALLFIGALFMAYGRWAVKR